MLTYGGYNDRDVIIDFHTHIISPRLTRQRDSLMKRDKTFEALFSDSKAVTASCEDLITAMDRVGVSKSVVLGYGWCELQIAREKNSKSVALFLLSDPTIDVDIKYENITNIFELTK